MSDQKQAEFKLTYFSFGGRALQIRLALRHGQVCVCVCVCVEVYQSVCVC
jgi:hypothetical protein